MQDFVVSKDLAEKLKEAGFPQTTTHVWTNNHFKDWTVVESDETYDHGEIGEAGTMAIAAWSYQEEMDSGAEYDDVIAAPLSDEILAQLPDSIPDTQNKHHYDCPNCNCTQEYICMLEIRKGAIAYVSMIHSRAIPYYAKYEKLANGLAELWLFCKANNYLDKR